MPPSRRPQRVARVNRVDRLGSNRRAEVQSYWASGDNVFNWDAAIGLKHYASLLEGVGRGDVNAGWVGAGRGGDCRPARRWLRVPAGSGVASQVGKRLTLKLPLLATSFHVQNFMKKLMATYQNITGTFNSDNDKAQSWIIEASKAANQDLTTFFAKWHFPIDAATTTAIAALSLPAIQFDVVRLLCFAVCVLCMKLF